MRKVVVALFAVLALLAMAGCQKPQSAADGNLPALAPIGPIPGSGVAPAGPTNPYANNAVAITQGRKLFIWYNCYTCHGGHGGGAIGPSLRGLKNASAARIYDFISQGRATGMPAWGLKIPQQQIWQLVAYIQSMGTPQEPNPPR